MGSEKGYIVTANNRQTSDNVINEHGAALISPARAERITQIIEEGISAGKKFNIEDMSRI